MNEVVGFILWVFVGLIRLIVGDVIFESWIDDLQRRF